MSANQKKMFIVYMVAYIADISGGPRVIVEHANCLARLGHRVEIWTSAAGDRPYFECNVPVKSHDTQQLSQPDIVVLTDLSLLQQLSGRRKGSTFLLLQHDNDWVIEMNHGPAAAQQAGFTEERLKSFKSGQCQLIVVSSWLHDTVKEKYDLESHLVVNGIDPSVFRPTIPSFRAEEPIALTFYDPQKWKGFEEAFLALAEVRKKYSKLKVMIVGRFMPPFPEINGTYSSFSIPVIYFNRPAQEDLAKIFSSASVFISSSWREGFGLPGLEALASGVPLVTTDSGGVREYAIPNKTAVVVPPKDIPGLVHGVMQVLDQPTLSRKLKRNGLKKAAEFHWDMSIKKLEDIFRAQI